MVLAFLPNFETGDVRVLRLTVRLVGGNFDSLRSTGCKSSTGRSVGAGSTNSAALAGGRRECGRLGVNTVSSSGVVGAGCSRAMSKSLK